MSLVTHLQRLAMPLFIVAALAFTCTPISSAAAALQPPLTSLASDVIAVRTCNPHTHSLTPCTAPDVNTTDARSCADLGCCFFEGTCFQPNDQTSPASNDVQRYAANQAVASLSSLAGQLQVDASGDPLGLTCTTMPPYSQSCNGKRPFAGNTRLVTDGQISPVSVSNACLNNTFKWSATTLLRQCTVPISSFNDSVLFNSETWILSTDHAVLLRLNASTTSTSHLSPTTTNRMNVTVDVNAMIRDMRSQTWSWTVPRPAEDDTAFTADTTISDDGTLMIVIRDKQSAALSVTAARCASVASSSPQARFVSATPSASPVSGGSGISVSCSLPQPPKGSGPAPALELVWVIANSSQLDQATQTALSLIADFDLAVVRASQEWEDYWMGAFLPKGSKPNSKPGRAFPSSLPTLKTDDTALTRAYYFGVLSLLINGQINEFTDGHVLFASAGPISAVTAMYIWDSTLVAVLWSLLDPEGYLTTYDRWVTMGIHQHYAVDYVSGNAVGPWYAFNDLQMFRALRVVASLHGPTQVLQRRFSNGRTGAQLMRDFATAWQQLQPQPSPPAPIHPSDQPCNVTGRYLGYWRQHGQNANSQNQFRLQSGGAARLHGSFSPGFVDMVEDETGCLRATNVQGQGWAHGNGTMAPDSGHIILDVYDASGKLHATIKGSCQQQENGTIDWDNGSSWCRNGSSLNCTGEPPAQPDILTDYGGASNLLECVPTYIHKVPALNAGNAWMMREVASLELLPAYANVSDSQHLNDTANQLAQAVLQRMYVNGSGYFQCIYPDGQPTQVRHIIDFVTVGACLQPWLPEDTFAEMTAFFRRELQTTYWARALSMEDAAASQSDRKDHGPWGSYDGWLGETMHAYSWNAQFAEASDILRRLAPVYAMGPGGQSHQVFGALGNTSALPAKAHADQQYFAISGAVPANHVIASLFGVNPPLDERVTDLSQWIRFPKQPRNMTATLDGIVIRGSTYVATSDESGVTLRPQN